MHKAGGRLVAPYRRMCAAAFLLDAAVAVSFTAAPFYVFNQLGGREALSGIIGGTQTGAYAFSCLLSALWVTRVRNGLALACAGIAGFALCVGLIPLRFDPLYCGILCALAMASLGLAWPAMESWIGGEPDEDRRARHLALFNLCTSFGFVAGPLLAGPLYDTWYWLPFAILPAFGMIIVVMVGSLPRERDCYHVAPASPAGLRAPQTDGLPVQLGWCAVFVASVLFAEARCIYPRRVEDLIASHELHLYPGVGLPRFLESAPATTCSWLLSLLSLAMALTFIAMGRWTRWRKRATSVVLAQVAAVPAFWILGETRSLVMMMACFAVIGVTYGMCFFQGSFLSLADAARKHRWVAITEGSVGVGGLVGGALLGPAAEHLGLKFLVYATTALVAAGLCIQAIVLRRQRDSV